LLWVYAGYARELISLLYLIFAERPVGSKRWH
jgi:hypothetical protein